MNLNRILEAAPAIVAVYNYQMGRFEYISNNAKQVLGYYKEDFLMLDMESLLKKAHPEFSKIFREYITPKMQEDFSKYKSKYNLKKLKFSCDFWLKPAKGDYKWFNQQMTIIETTKDGSPLLGLIYFVDITDYKSDCNINYTVSNNVNNQTKVLSTTKFTIGNKTLLNSHLTDRELEVVKLMAGGLTSCEIAVLLNISTHTVNNHRKNMLEKSKVRNTAELLKMVMEFGIV